MSKLALTPSHPPPPGYTATARLLHWVIAGLIVAQYILAELAEEADKLAQPVQQLALLANHKSVGITLLLLSVLRIAWRLANKPPPLPSSVPSWQQHVSHWGHIALYLIVFLLPVTGWLMSSASAYSVSWFGLWQLPDLVAVSESQTQQWQTLHHWLAEALFVLAVVHIGAALKHQFWDNNRGLMRMFNVTGALAFGATLGLSLLVLTNTANLTQAAIANPVVATTTASSDNQIPTCRQHTKLPQAWVIDQAASELGFSGDQAGASFSGVFEKWQARVHFDPEHLDHSCAVVSIELTSVNTQDADRDATARDNEWLAVAQQPQAYFSATHFSAQGSGYLAAGQLHIKGQVAPIPFTFTLVDLSDGQHLQGKAQLDRLALGLGTGDWLDTSWVGQSVNVQVSLRRLANGTPPQ